MNYRIKLEADTCSIIATGDAVGPNVCASLRLARAALADMVDEQIARLRAAKKAALKVRDNDLPSDVREPEAAQ